MSDTSSEPRDYDNRTPEDVIAFLEARVEVLTRRVKELERRCPFCGVQRVIEEDQ